MIPAVAVGGLVASTGALRWLGRLLVDRAWPAVAVPVIAAGALLNAGSLLVVVGLLALATAGRWSVAASLGDWAPDVLASTVPEPLTVGLASAAATTALVAQMLWRFGQLVVQLGRADRLSRRLRGGGGPIAFVDTPATEAFTVAGVRGCVVIGRALFNRLGAAERRVVIAHELSHLRRRHHLYLHAVDLAAAANPLLGPLRSTVRLGVERWADEDAASACDARAAAGCALARAALTQAALRRSAADSALDYSATALGATAVGVSARAQALLDRPAPRRSRTLAALVTVLLATSVLCLGSVLQIHDGFERAEIDQVSTDGGAAP